MLYHKQLDFDRAWRRERLYNAAGKFRGELFEWNAEPLDQRTKNRDVFGFEKPNTSRFFWRA